MISLLFSISRASYHGYGAMVLNQFLHRTGHFWEQRYFSQAISNNDSDRILKTLRYIHANPKAAGLRLGFTYAFSNYGSYAQLSRKSGSIAPS